MAVVPAVSVTAVLRRLCVVASRSLRSRWYEGTVPCNASAAIASADALFRRKGSASSLKAARASDGSVAQAYKDDGNTAYSPVGAHCSLMARKFGGSALRAVLKLAADCERGFGWGRACMGAG